MRGVLSFREAYCGLAPDDGRWLAGDLIQEIFKLRPSAEQGVPLPATGDIRDVHGPGSVVRVLVELDGPRLYPAAAVGPGLAQEHDVSLDLIIQPPLVSLLGGHVALAKASEHPLYAPVLELRQAHVGIPPNTDSASNTGPSTHTRFIAGPCLVWTSTTQPAHPPTAQAMNSSRDTWQGSP